MSDRTHLPLSLERVSYAANGRTLLDNVELVLEGQQTTLLLGPNGAGKSLLLRLCHGLLEPAAGTITSRLGRGIGRDARQLQAMVFQRPVLLRRSARANIEHALAVRGVGRQDRRARAIAALERFGLAALATRPARVLSGGEQQRLAIARAWALAPELLFLDEPTSALDPAATRAVEAAIAAVRAGGTTIVMSSHDLGQARRLADRVVFMAGGRIVEVAPAERFFSRPATPQASAFLRGDLVL
jgi:tungstate transport system ATP-binding protein